MDALSQAPLTRSGSPPLALDPYLVEQRYHRQHLRIFGVSNFVILDAWFSPDQCWGVLAGLCALATLRPPRARPPARATHERDAGSKAAPPP